MKIPALLSVALLALAPAVGCASSHDFDNIVARIEQRYSVHAQRTPIMGFVSLCARVASHNGVKGMRVAEFDNLTLRESDDLNRLVRDTLGPQWQLFVVDREAGGEQSIIYVQPHGDSMRMIIADYEGGELDLVRIELNGDRLRAWMRNPTRSAREHIHHGKGSPA